MSKIVSWLIAAILSYILSNTVFANTFAGGIPEDIPYTYDGITYDRYITITRINYDECTNTHALYFVSSEMEANRYPSGYPYSLIRGGFGSDGNRPLFITGPDGTHMAFFTAEDNHQGTCVWQPDAIPLIMTQTVIVDLSTDKEIAIHGYNFELHTTGFFSFLLPYTFTGEYASWGTWYEGYYEKGSFFGFPVPQDNNNNSLTPYNAKVSAVMDHSMTTPYSKDGVVLTFNSVQGNQENLQDCYSKAGGGRFNFGLNYVGTSNIGGKFYLCYDGHPGYDYPFTKGTPIHSATAGILCVATSKTAYDGSSLWRNQDYCPLSKAGGTNWNGYHTFYIIHKSLLFNGSVDDYMTVYLHNSDLAPSVEGVIKENGYALVMDREYVADVGKVGTTGNHLHFETYKWNPAEVRWDRVDPYGDGVNNILWNRDSMNTK